jgi:hypothetical protein
LEDHRESVEVALVRIGAPFNEAADCAQVFGAVFEGGAHGGCADRGRGISVVLREAVGVAAALSRGRRG